MSLYFDMDGKPIELMEWAKIVETPGARKVAETKLSGGVRVSTVLLGLDHSFGGGKPIIFETMVFGGKLDQEEDRYATRQEAENGHRAMVNRVRATEAK